MKKFEFNPEHQQWDRFKEFHACYQPFVEFANGQLIITNPPDLYQRKMYERYNIELVSTTAPDVPRLYLNKDDDKPIPKAWVQQGGQQLLAVDYEQGVAVAIGYCGYYYGRGHTNPNYSEGFNNTVPDNLCGQAFVYWAGHGRLPVASKKITVSVAEQELTKKLRDHLKSAMPALHAIYRMKADESQRYWGTAKLELHANWLELTTEELVAELSKDWHTLKCAVKSGFLGLRDQREVDYLYVK
jgi:hypothetical protein